MTQKLRLTAFALAAAIGLTVTAPLAAEASSKGERNTAIAAGAVGVYGIVKKKPLLAGLGTGVGIYSYMKSRETAKKEKARRHTVRRVRTVRKGGKVYRQVYYVRR